LILGATERRLIHGGPEAIRLQDIAADVGISHSTILHHFRSRERLLAALAERAIEELQRELLAILATRRPNDPLSNRAARSAEMLERIHRLFEGRGYARLFAGLILSGRKLQRRIRGTCREFAREMHDSRVERRIEDRKPAPSWEDTVFTLTTAWVTVFGDSLFGPIARATVGLPDDAETGRRFHRWMADRVEGYVPEATSVRHRRRR